MTDPRSNRSSAALNTPPSLTRSPTMGVRSLTTFLHENRQALSRTTVLHAADGSSPPIPLVVDAWGCVDIRLSLDPTSSQLRVCH